jgi:hypothetical protein
MKACAVRYAPHVPLRQIELLQPLVVRQVVVADRGHDERRPAEHVEAVGDVSGAAAELAAQVRHQERDVQDVQLVGQDMVLEAVAEHHDGVVGDRAADQRAHGGRISWRNVTKL